MIVEGGDPRRCPFVRAVVDEDESTVHRLNEADGDPLNGRALDLLRVWAAGAAVVHWIVAL